MDLTPYFCSGACADCETPFSVEIRRAGNPVNGGGFCREWECSGCGLRHHASVWGDSVVRMLAFGPSHPRVRIDPAAAVTAAEKIISADSHQQ